MNTLIKVLMSVLIVIPVYALIDYYFTGLNKYILWGITVAAVLAANKKNTAT
ncbi:hypothetical protein [Rossellomorea vietnamensis]|uniref:hypothetical protein n=1 Tax=Rossellomorea vietnamensis TaxID=218284 RepID=UPI001653BFD9|nr:hypothetical protein [Rossellomorea vietnamensis]